MPKPAANAYSIEDLRQTAKRRLPRAVFDFFDGGAEDEQSLREKRAAFGRHKLLPRVLVVVAEMDMSTELLSAPSALPIAVGPTGAVGFGWPGGNVSIAQAAAAVGIPYAQSATGTASIERIAREAPGRHWFQAYVLRDQDFFHQLIDRALAADYEALMITVDLPVGGKRERDFRNHFSIPFKFTAQNVLDLAQHPRWVLGIARHGMPQMENLSGLNSGKGTAAALKIASSVGKNYDASFNWERLRDCWPEKLIVKGVAHPQDAVRLADMGCDAVVILNHGGRHLDGGTGTLDLLPGILAVVRGRVPVLVDGGVRRGADVLKARALGAQGVLVVRVALYGAVAAGGAGARCALDIVHDGIGWTIRLCGVRRFDDIDRGLLAPYGRFPSINARSGCRTRRHGADCKEIGG